MSLSLGQLAQLTGASLHGDPQLLIHGVAGLRNARHGEIALLADPRYARHLPKTAASALVVGPDFDISSTDLPLLVAEQPEAAFEKIAARFAPPERTYEPGIHPTAVVADDATIAPDASVGAFCVVEAGATIGAGTVLRPFVFVGQGATIGARCLLHPGAAVLDRCVVGDGVILHSGVVVGADGFGYAQAPEGRHQKIPQVGTVEIADDVEIGANSTVDRARYGRTIVAQGTKIDNLVMVAHNVVVGENCLLVSQCGIAGSTVLGKNVTLAAQAGLVGHIEVGDGAIVGAQAGVTRDVPPGKILLGSPAQEIEKERRCMVVHQHLPDLARQVRQLAREVEELKKKVRQLEAETENDSH